MALTAPPIPALTALLDSEFGGAFEVGEHTTIVGVLPTLIVPHNFERLGLVIINMSQSACYVSPSSNVSATAGIIMITNGSTISMTARDDLAMVGHEWYALGAAGNQNIYVMSVNRYRIV